MENIKWLQSINHRHSREESQWSLFVESGPYLSQDLRLEISCNNTVELTMDYRAISRVINHGKLCCGPNKQSMLDPGLWSNWFCYNILSDPSAHIATNKQVSDIVVDQVYQLYPAWLHGAPKNTQHRIVMSPQNGMENGNQDLFIISSRNRHSSI